MATRKRADKFPLWLHQTGQWAKKIRGKMHYFGVDRDKALKEYIRVKDDLEGGRKPRPVSENDRTVAELVNAFLTAKRERVEAGELSPGMWSEYHRTAEQIVTTFGQSRVLSDIRPDDFGKLRAAAAKRLGHYAISKFITMTRTIFTYAYEMEYIDVPVRYGTQFDKPPKRIMRLERALKARKLIDAENAWKLIDGADVQLRAMILLALNAGFGQTDCSNLDRRSITGRPGWVYAPRRKTGTERRAPLWPETIEALEAVHAARPEPKDPADADCVFITRHRNRWVRFADKGGGRRGVTKDAVAYAFFKLVKATGATVPGGFYVLRHTFRTVADGLKDQPAVMLLMGHQDQSISSYYREHIDDARLQAVTDHVRAWLLAGKPTPGDPAAQATSGGPE